MTQETPRLQRYLIRLSNTAKLKPKQIREISARLSRLVEGFHGTVANVRISDIAV